MGGSSVKCTMLPQRVILCLILFLGIVVTYAIRACLSIAITEMVTPINNSPGRNESLICPTDSTVTESATLMKAANDTKYDWSQNQQGWILSAFSIGYVMSHIPGGLLAEKFGGKCTLSISMLILLICNGVTPPILEYGGDKALSLLIVLRMLMGVGAGPLFPSITVLLAAWIPQKETGKLGTLVLGGGQIGSLLSLTLSGELLTYWTWPIVFYFWSFLTAVWLIVFTIFCHSDPASHPSISDKESDYLSAELGQLKRNKHLPSPPWIDIITSTPIIVLIVSQIGSDWFYNIWASDLPKYMREVLGFSVRETGVYTSLPYLLMWIVSILSGFVCDYLISHHFISVLNARKLFTALSGIFPAIFIVAASYAGCNRLLVVLCFILSKGFNGNYYPGMRVNVLDLSPNYAGSIIAIVNGLGALSGIVAPIFVGIMTPDSSLEQWRFVFWTTCGIGLLRTVIYLIWASADIQPWNEPLNKKQPECDKLTETVDKC